MSEKSQPYSVNLSTARKIAADVIAEAYAAGYERSATDLARLRGALEQAISVMEATEEINPSNYDHDLVCQLNAGFCHAYSIIEAALQEMER